MLEAILRIEKAGHGSLQAKLREKISEAIAHGLLEEGEKLPSTRSLARYLGISRNTVTLVYHDLMNDGYLVSKDRSGYIVAAINRAAGQLKKEGDRLSTVNWEEQFAIRAEDVEPARGRPDWRSRKYKFVYGQHDRWLFPISNWRKCSRESLSLHDMQDWTVDYVDGDDPLLLDAFRKRVLPRRGFVADSSEILVTVGAQNALFLVAQVLIKPGIVVAVEDPCYPDARAIFNLFGAVLRPIPVDEEGIIVDDRLVGCDLVYVTPALQSPTTVEMSGRRRKALLEAAHRHDFLIVEDDYDTESRFSDEPNMALKSQDQDGRVIYTTSLSKLLSPGLRVGFLLGPKPFIDMARMLRRLNIRHPAANNQRTVALFLKGGYYEALLKQFHKEYKLRRATLIAAVRKHVAEAVISKSAGGSSIWMRLPSKIDTPKLAERCFQQDVFIEPGVHHFIGEPKPRSYVRLGFSSIQVRDIEPGIVILAREIYAMLND